MGWEDEIMLSVRFQITKLEMDFRMWVQSSPSSRWNTKNKLSDLINVSDSLKIEVRPSTHSHTQACSWDKIHWAVFESETLINSSTLVL